jgi:hypothetical protein
VYVRKAEDRLREGRTAEKTTGFYWADQQAPDYLKDQSFKNRFKWHTVAPDPENVRLAMKS